MPGGRTPLDHALNSRNAFLAFTGIVTAASVWAIWGQDIFPAQPDPTGDPATWTEPELRRWLTSVRTYFPSFLAVVSLIFVTYLWFQYRLRPRRVIQASQHVTAVKATKASSRRG